jgi:prolyl oligopeptidase
VFFTRNNGLENQSVLYWSESLRGAPKVLLDPNQLAADGTIALIDYAVSKDGRYLAYGLSSSGSDWQEWHVREVDSGEDLDDVVRWVKFSGAEWSPDNLGFYYGRYDAPEDGLAYKEANYNQKLYYHRIGTSQCEDELVYERPDQKEWGYSATVSDDGRYLVITVSQGTHREKGILFKDLHSTGGAVEDLSVEFDAAYSFAGNDGATFYLLTDLNAPLGRLVAIDVTRPDESEWREIIPESSDALRSVNLVGGKFFASYLHDAHALVTVFDAQGRLERRVELPGIGDVTGFEGGSGDQETFYLFTGFTTPGTVYHYDVASGQSAVFRAPETSFGPDRYVTKQVFYESKDGTAIPMFLTHRRDVKLDGNNPTYLYGYGGFNICQTPSFSPSNALWLEMGGIYAQANLRGGGEYGKAWHHAGSKLVKQNVFDDFIAAAEWLIANGYTRTPRLAIGGRSNGGLLVGACLTQRPDLFGACLPIVGVLDMLRFHKFTIGWAWTSDYGSPDDEDEFGALLAYSPYHNVKPGAAYPPTLIATGDHDDRVFPAHSFKFAAALQSAQGSDDPILIRIETKAGHGLGKPTTKLIAEFADMWTFLVHALDMDFTTL